MESTEDSYLTVLAKQLVHLIERWRAELNDGKPIKAPSAATVEKYLDKSVDRGLAAELIAITILSCEWVFRIKRADNEDIEGVLKEMEARLHKPLGPIFTPLQAHLLINCIASDIRRQLRHYTFPIVSGFHTENFDSFVDWNAAPAGPRTAPKPIVHNRSGRLPLLGPIVAGIIVDALAATISTKGHAALGNELCSLLLGRRVQPSEFYGWRKRLNDLQRNGRSFVEDFRMAMQRAYEQTFVTHNSAVSTDVFLKHCESRPGDFLFWLNQDDILKSIYSVKWG